MIALGICTAIALIVFLIAFSVPKDFKIERSVSIERPVSTVFTFLKSVRNHDSWNPWLKKDPFIQRSFKGEDGTPGFIYSWSGNDQVGTGEQEIKAIREGQRIDFELRFLRPFRATNCAYLETQGTQTSTLVKWGMTGRLAFPMNLVQGLMKGKLRKDFDEGLQMLKATLENRA